MRLLSGHKQLPPGQGGRAAELVSLAVDDVAFRVEVIVHASVHRGEFLQRLHLSEPQHCTLSSSEREVAVFDPVVLPAADLAAITVAEFAHRGGVRSEPVGDDRFRLSVALECLLHEGESRGFVPFPGDEALQDLTFVIDRAPQIDHLDIDLHEHFVEAQAPMSEALHPADPLPTNVRRKYRPEPVLPEPYRFMANVNAALE